MTAGGIASVEQLEARTDANDSANADLDGTMLPGA